MQILAQRFRFLDNALETVHIYKMAEAPRTHFPSGHDEEFLSEVEDDFLCLICHSPLKEPFLTRCGHRFCKECLEEHLRRQEIQAQPLTCPADRETLDRDRDVFLDKATGRKILSFAIKCPSEDCGWTGELRNKEVHLGTCPSKVVSCTNESCHVTLKRKDLEQHVTTTCEWRIIECEYSKEPHPECHMQDHIEKCNKFPLACPNSCGDSIPREMISNHIEDDCLLTLISYPYVQIGCNEKVQRKNVQSHLQLTIQEHLNFACVELSDTRAQFQEKTRKLEKKVETLQRQLEIKMNTDRENNNTRFVWKINKFSEILSQTKAGTKETIESDPFYTERYGYKLQVVLYPNGSGLFAWNRFLAVVISVLEGEYDAMLPWPFNKKVTFTLIDQQEETEKRENVVQYLSPDEKYRLTPDLFSKRPKKGEYFQAGLPCFIAHQKLQTRRYLVDDTLFIQVDIGPQ